MVTDDETASANIQFTCERRYGSISKHLKACWYEPEVASALGPIDILALDITPLELNTKNTIIYRQLKQLVSQASIILIPNVKKVSSNRAYSSLFESLASEYQSILFSHGDGLGVIFKNSFENELLRTLILRWSNIKSKKTIEDIFSHLGRACEDQALIEVQSHEISEFNKELGEVSDKLNKKSLEAQSLAKTLDELVELAKKKDSSIRERFSELAKITQLLEARDGEINRLTEKNKYLESQSSLKDHLIENHLTQLAYFSSKLKEFDIEKGIVSEKLKKEYEDALVLIEQKKVKIDQLEEKISHFSQIEETYKNNLLELEKENREVKKNLEEANREYNKTIKQKNASISRRDEELSKLVSLVDGEKKKNTRLVSNLRKFNLEQSREGDLSQNKIGSRGSREKKVGAWSTLFGKKNNKTIFKDMEEILISEYFDSDWYLKQYPDVAEHSLYSKSPALHYLIYGAFEDRNPSPYFDSQWYLDSNPDVARSQMNPLLHFLRNGLNEERSPKDD
ncbi:hypothetical protein LMG33810_000560 [Carnimonas sp. LMG 33810]